MDTYGPEDYVSIIGMSYLHPISALLEVLQSSNLRGPNELQASAPENGYSAATIILTVLLVESAIRRTQYIRNEQLPKQSMIDFVRTTYSTSGFVDKIEELFVVRDVIAHNHVWEAQYTWDEQVGMRLIAAQLRDGYGDAKFRRVLDTNSRKTRQLGINLFPTRICRNDAVVVLKVAVDFLLFLENEDRRYLYISQQSVKFDGNYVLFVNLVSSLYTKHFAS
jgi:hypothetical protein